jgi:hypothetical protein
MRTRSERLGKVGGIPDGEDDRAAGDVGRIEGDAAPGSKKSRNLSITQGKMAGKLLVESGHAHPVARHP